MPCEPATPLRQLDRSAGALTRINIDMNVRLTAITGLALCAVGCSLVGLGNKSKTNGENNANGVSREIKTGGFLANLPEGFSQPTDDAGRLLLKEYGALFVAKGGPKIPTAVFFKNDAEVTAFQSGVQAARETIGKIPVELQAIALKHLKDAVAEAKKGGASITPRGADASKRSYKDTVGLWTSRVDPGLNYWVGKGKITKADLQRIRALSPFDQIPEILKLEDQGMLFSKDMKKSIIYSVAPPGSSQHLSMLAFDVSEHENANVRTILAKHGWFQTVISDLPHFTFMGVSETALPKLGLKKVTDGGRVFWVPDI